MRESGRCALARWVWKGKQYVVQVRRGARSGLILQQLLYADEVRSMKDLDIEKADVSKPELQLALQLIDQISAESYDPLEFKDEEKKRVLAAIDDKIAGKQIVESVAPEPTGGQVIDLMDALRASLAVRPQASGREGNACRDAGDGGNEGTQGCEARRRRCARRRSAAEHAPASGA